MKPPRTIKDCDTALTTLNKREKRLELELLCVQGLQTGVLLRKGNLMEKERLARDKRRRK